MPEKLNFVIVVGENCPDCEPCVNAVKKHFPNSDILVLNIDKEQESIFAESIVYSCGIVYKDVFPIPQVFLQDEKGTHFLALYVEPEEKFIQLLKERIEKIRKGQARGRFYAVEDAKTLFLYEKEKPVPLSKGFLETLVKKGFAIKVKVFGRETYIDINSLVKLIENKFNCLCIKGLKCPCPAFVKNGYCHCGVFFVLPPEEKVEEKKKEEKEAKKE